MTKISVDKAAVLRQAWFLARHAAVVTGEPLRSRIGPAMRAAWALAKAAVVVAVPQPVQQQQADAAPAEPKPVTRDEILSRIRINAREGSEAVAEIERRRAVNGGYPKLDAWLLDGVRTSAATLREQLAEHDHVAMESPPAQGFRVVKVWLDEAEVLQTLTFPMIYERAQDATGEIVSLLGGRDPALFSAAERDAGALLTMEEVGPAPAMVPQPCQQQQASAAEESRDLGHVPAAY